MSDDLDDRMEQAEGNWQEASSGPPPDGYEWGFFCYGDAPAAIGGGVGMFTWFRNRNDMLDFIETTLPYYPPGPYSSDVEAAAADTTAVVEKMRTNALSVEEGMEALNEVLEGFSQFTWIGTVPELLSGDHDYLVRVRGAFREDFDDGLGVSPIMEDEREAFFEFLEGWGF